MEHRIKNSPTMCEGIEVKTDNFLWNISPKKNPNNDVPGVVKMDF